jgi:hypothetical protein
MEADQPAIPDSENCAFLVTEFRETVGMDRRFHVNVYGEWSDPRDTNPNRLLSKKSYDAIEKEFVDTEQAWPIIEQISLKPRGRFQLVEDRDWWKWSRAADQRPENVNRFLEFQCERFARDRRATHALTAMFARINLARIDGVAPCEGSQQYADSREVCRWTERLLALDSLGDDLASLQHELRKESEADASRNSIRRTRAVYDRLFQALDQNESSVVYYLTYRSDPTNEELLKVWLYRPHLPSDWVDAIDYATQCLAIADLPEHLRWAAFQSLPTPPGDKSHFFSNGCSARLWRDVATPLAATAQLRSTVAALAVERYRLLKGDWPETLDAIPKSILPSVPLDPFTGKPLLYVRRADGVTVYSVGLDGWDDGGKVEPHSLLEKSGHDIGFRLYNIDQRRLPPLQGPVE